MRLLLDAHAFLWFLLDDPQLSVQGDALIDDTGNDILVSPATLWEIAIKITIGKYSLPEPFSPFMERELAANAFEILHNSIRHTELVSALPFHHKDPFDRILRGPSHGRADSDCERRRRTRRLWDRKTLVIAAGVNGDGRDIVDRETINRP